MDSKTVKKLLGAIILSIGFMFFLLRRVEWKHFSSIAERLDIEKLIIGYGLFILGNYIRTLRFHRLDHTGNKRIYWWKITQFYNFLTATLPGGAGEAATSYVIKRFSTFNLLSALRLLFLTRLMDLFALSALFFITTLQLSHAAPYRGTAIWISFSLLLASLLALMPVSERLILRLLQKLPIQSRLREKASEKLSELLSISEEQLKSSSLGINLLQSVLMMATVMVSVHMILLSYGIEFTLLQSFYCFGIYAIFQTVPVQGIAGLGTQAAWWALALNAAGYNGNEAIALGFVFYGTFYLFIALLALSTLPMWFMERKKKQ